jgi:group II intron reverse transcriptase/maturase
MMQKVHSLTGRITMDMMRKAYRNVRRNRGAAGIDQVSVRRFGANLEQNLQDLMRDLKTGVFQPLPLRRTYIPKSPTQQRPLGIPVVRDRVAQDVVRQLLEPVFTPRFHARSFGFIRGRNCHQAIHDLLEAKSSGLRWVVDADIRSFFDRIPHGLISRLLSEVVADGNILRIVERFLRSGVMEDGHCRPTTEGTPQGGVISPLLANLVLNQLDWRLEQAGYVFVRYADDLVVLCASKPEAEEALALVRAVIETDMGLQLHPDKTRVVHARDGFDFLGFRITTRGVRMRDQAVERFRTTIRDLTVRSHNLDEAAIEAINRVIRGTVNYFGVRYATVKTQLAALDRFVRSRLRYMKYKRIWKTDRRRLRNKHLAHRGLLACLDLWPAVRRRPIRSPA